jgi:hypothetical protein
MQTSRSAAPGAAAGTDVLRALDTGIQASNQQRSRGVHARFPARSISDAMLVSGGRQAGPEHPCLEE